MGSNKAKCFAKGVCFYFIIVGNKYGKVKYFKLTVPSSVFSEVNDYFQEA